MELDAVIYILRPEFLDDGRHLRGSLIETTFEFGLLRPALVGIEGLLNTFLYHCVSDPHGVSLFSTNQTGIEVTRPEFLVVTLILISR